MRNNTDIFVDYVFIDKITNTGHVLLYGKGVNNNIIAIVLTIIFLTSINIAYSVQCPRRYLFLYMIMPTFCDVTYLNLH